MAEKWRLEGKTTAMCDVKGEYRYSHAAEMMLKKLQWRGVSTGVVFVACCSWLER